MVQPFNLSFPEHMFCGLLILPINDYTQELPNGVAHEKKGNKRPFTEDRSDCGSICSIQLYPVDQFNGNFEKKTGMHIFASMRKQYD